VPVTARLVHESEEVPGAGLPSIDSVVPMFVTVPVTELSLGTGNPLTEIIGGP
jgi:hypothetical protein